jgi:hypothetical protein
MSYVYKKTEPKLWTVGFYSPDGKFQPESDYSSSDEAAKRVHYLNGGTSPYVNDALDAIASACALQSVSSLHAQEVFSMIGKTAATALAKAKGK